MLYAIQFYAYKADGEIYSLRFAFHKTLMDAKKAAIKLYKSSPHIARVVAVDKETGKIIKRVPDGRGGYRGGGRKAFDGQAREHRLSMRIAEDIYQILSSVPDKSGYVHKAIRFYNKNNTQS